MTAAKGNGAAETHKHFPVKKGDCIIGDRAYSTALGIEHLHNHGAYSIVRVNTSSLPLYLESGKRMELLSEVGQLQSAGQIGEWSAWIKKSDGSFIHGRICAVRKSEVAVAQAIKKLKRKACTGQKNLQPTTIEFAKYIIVFTTLSSEHFPSFSVLEWYRLRWQIELIFKRLKSLAGLGHLPKYDETSSRAWLYGKLFVGLLTEKLIAGIAAPKLCYL